MMVNTTLIHKRYKEGRRTISSHLTRNIRPSSISVVKAKGVTFYDSKGKPYLDFSSQTLNLNFGQVHPEITKAVIRQIKSFTFVSSRFENPVLMDLTNQLLSIAPATLNKINLKLVNGSDANESAFKRIRKRSNKEYVITFYKTHLGESSETLSASGRKNSYIGGSNKFLFVTPPFRQFFKNDGTKNLEDRSLSRINKLLKKNSNIAGIAIEPIMVNAGVYGFSSYYLGQLREICQKYSISLIFDEIQTAFGWLGTYFASDYFGVIPDLITMGKGLAAGYPLAGVLMKEEYDVLDYGEDEYTYGGHPASCAAAIACLNLLKETAILDQVKKKSQLLRKRVSILQQKYPCINEIRIFGLICGIEFNNQDDHNLTNKIYDLCLENGLLLRKTEDGKGSSLVLKPPIIVTERELNKAIDILDQALRSISGNGILKSF